MTIDKAIEFCKDKSENIKLKSEPQTFIQLAEWLEELREYQLQHYKLMEYYKVNSIEDIYDKAIDNFTEQLKSKKTHFFDGSEGVWDDDIQKIAEQLKKQNCKKTLIVSAFPACGKTYLYENQDKLKFKYNRENTTFSFCDSDSSHYDKCEGWEKQYVNDIEKKLGSVDFIFISQHEKILKELDLRKIPFVVIAPDNSEYLLDKERKLIKQQWFGRFVLRDNSHIKNFENWFKLLKANYDVWTNIENLIKYNPVNLFLLKENQYIEDIIEDLYYKKENYADYTIREKKIND